MVVFGLLLILFAALAVVAGLFASDGTAEFVGVDMSAFVIFLIGLAAGLAFLWGYTIAKYGVRKSFQHRRESKQLQELSDKLDKVDEEKRREVDDERI
jgi:hypothetical protein